MNKCVFCDGTGLIYDHEWLEVPKECRTCFGSGSVGKVDLGKIAERSEELEQAKSEANSLAMSIFNRHYKENSTVGFKLIDSVPGVISQIDNMTAGLFERIEKLEASLVAIMAAECSVEGLQELAHEALKADE